MSETISIQTLAACEAEQHVACFGWLETDAKQGLGVRCGCHCHRTEGWKFDRAREAHAEIEAVMRRFNAPGLFAALRGIERKVLAIYDERERASVQTDEAAAIKAASDALDWFDKCGAHEGAIPYGGDAVADGLRVALGRLVESGYRI